MQLFTCHANVCRRLRNPLENNHLSGLSFSYCVPALSLLLLGCEKESELAGLGFNFFS